MKRLAALVLLPALLLAGCAGTGQPAPTPALSSEARRDATFLAMDTVMTFTVYGDKAQEALDMAQSEVERLEDLLSVTREGSQVWNINHAGGGAVAVDGDAAALVLAARELGDATGGALDVTLYPVVKLWGFTTGEYRVPDQEEIDAALARTGCEKIGLDQVDGKTAVDLPEGMEIDFGALAKGYAGEVCAQRLREMGVESAILRLAGNIQTIGAKPDGSPWRVGIQDPAGDAQDTVGVVSLVDQAAVTSGGYQRFFEEDGVRYWHIIDPATGAPARSGLTSVTIVGESGTVCDGLSTALFVMGLDRGLDYWRERRDFEAILIGEDRDVYITAGLAESFSLTENSGYTLRIVEE